MFSYCPKSRIAIPALLTVGWSVPIGIAQQVIGNGPSGPVCTGPLVTHRALKLSNICNNTPDCSSLEMACRARCALAQMEWLSVLSSHNS